MHAYGAGAWALLGRRQRWRRRIPSIACLIFSDGAQYRKRDSKAYTAQSLRCPYYDALTALAASRLCSGAPLGSACLALLHRW